MWRDRTTNKHIYNFSIDKNRLWIIMFYWALQNHMYVCTPALKNKKQILIISKITRILNNIYVFLNTELNWLFGTNNWFLSVLVELEIIFQRCHLFFLWRNGNPRSVTSIENRTTKRRVRKLSTEHSRIQLNKKDFYMKFCFWWRWQWQWQQHIFCEIKSKRRSNQ